ncbi:alcohol dehydrogenase GroES-like domain-containing protein [Daldinia bambusicola]|nr:alcohol dehydrogenase GroES-like domain-containing protein [Daldinia bambusicola]
MSYRKALVGLAAGEYHVVHDLEIPQPKPDEMLCRVAAVALNHVDAKIIDYSPVPGIGGYDFAGEVIQIGTGVTRFKLGDRVLGLTFGLNPDNLSAGSFSEFALATEDLSCRIPPSMSYEQAATLPNTVGTAGLALYIKLGLPMPNSIKSDSGFVLVSGGATATGQVAVQLLKLSGLKPVATCSPGNNDMLRSLGAVETFDYHSPTCGRQIRNYTGNSLSYALDCITTTETMSMCYEAIGREGGKYTALEPPSAHVKYTRRDVHVDWVLVMTLLGNPIMLDGHYGRPPIPIHRRFAREFFESVEGFLEQDLLRSPLFQVRAGGLEGVKEGINELRTNQAQGGKLVYTLA